MSSGNYFEKILRLNKVKASTALASVDLESDLLLENVLRKVNIEKEDIYETDAGEYAKILEELAHHAKETESKLQPLTKLTRSKSINLESGISLLNSKNEIFANYLICLNYYMLYKLNGITLKDSALIKKLIYYKTLLAKLKPVETKMDY